MLEFSHLSVMRNGKPLFSDLSFRLRPGKITALLGKNGCGKSTLLSCITGLIPYCGNIFLNGQDIAHLSSKMRARSVAQLAQFLPDTPFTVRQLAEMGRTPHIGPDGRLTPADRQAVEIALQEVDMIPPADRPVNTLSGGERQRAFLAMLIAQNTPVVLLDEPSTFLDAGAAAMLYQRIVSLSREQGKTVLAVIHDLSAAVSIADDIAILDGGRLVFFGTVEQCLSQQAIENTFGVSAYPCENGTVFFR